MGKRTVVPLLAFCSVDPELAHLCLPPAVWVGTKTHGVDTCVLVRDPGYRRASILLFMVMAPLGVVIIRVERLFSRLLMRLEAGLSSEEGIDGAGCWDKIERASLHAGLVEGVC